ncbi:centrosomal protein of 55 kDa [Triplophysa rosa]|uniref:Centrosomal protein of 55 kDa n=1 Tax=Triplophysa rosa TaxID=992332 RepID=A0A9W7WFB9_TRIRA|nr:centrosomal protein of 55 kDa [Triplophysa rosa]KAI7797085.1 centrosomal protein of 55 kDa [Triplophysa rosa]
MAANGAKEALVNKLGFKSSSSSKSAEMEMEKLKRENEQLKRSLEQTKRNGKHSDPDRAKLLERILALETLREKNSQQLLGKDQEMSSLREQLRAAHGDVVSSLQDKLLQKQQEAQQRESQFQALSKETEDLKNKCCAVSQRCEELEKQKGPSGEQAAVQEHLRDALEKNQSWLIYDQQREAYVQGIMARTRQLETQLNEALQQEHKEANSNGESGQLLEAEQARASRIQAELNDLRVKYEERSREAAEAREQLQEERKNSREALLEERRCSAERSARLQCELETVNTRLEEERRRVSELLQQVNVLQKSLVRQQEEKKRISVLEQQIHLSAKESESEKLERQTLQHQLHKVLKELRKARDQITRLESSKQQRESRFSEPSSCNRMDFERLTIQDQATSPSKVQSLMNESFLECPVCCASYPANQYRELLAHLDLCFS